MYQEHFGLEKRPFSSKVVGADVFVGPQTAAAMGAIKKALATDDAVMTVTGPAGVGKTTVVRRALDTLGDNRLMISIGRLKLGYDEVIELLLAGLGARQLPKSTVQRFAAFRRLLLQYRQQGTRVFILVEDATCVGIDALAELESLTAEDAGVSGGASIVLMAATGLPELLREPQLARLRQRVRMQQAINPLGATELRGYLNHCFRLAGGAFESVFECGADEALLRFSDGIPRVCNNIAEQALKEAAEQGLDQVSLELIEQTAAEEIGLSAGHSIEDIRSAFAQAEADQIEAEKDAVSGLSAAANQDALEGVASAIDDTPAAIVEDQCAVAEAEPVVAVDEPVTDDDTQPVETIAAPEDLLAQVADELAEEFTADAGNDHGVPELIQDTVPDLEILAPAPEAATAADAETSASETAVADAQPDRIQDEDVADAKPDRVQDEDVPEWDRDPTLAELRPDLDALERAIAVARGGDVPDEVPAETGGEAVEDTSLPHVPEITLDREIQAKIEEATEALNQTLTDIDDADRTIPCLPGDREEHHSLEATLGGDEKIQPLGDAATESSTTAGPESTDQADVAARPKPNSEEIEHMAKQLSKANSIEDVTDTLAETLFGDEFSMIAAEVAASVASGIPANDELELELEPETDAMETEQNAASPEPAEPATPEVQATQPPTEPAESDPLDTSASQRLATVRALNKGGIPPGAPPVPEPGESIVLSEQPDIPQPANGTEPETIEQQMNTSMTQTLKALNARLTEQEEEREEPKRGFFSRFRRS